MSKGYSHMGRKKHDLDAAHWNQRYTKGDTPWDHGAPSPGLVDFLKEQTYQPGEVLVPGCGRGHDCRELARHGFRVTGLDISPEAIQRAQRMDRRKAQSRAVEYRLADFLALPREFHKRFDWIFEHTCFCAIDPARRDDYVKSAAAALKPGGKLLGVFFNIQPESGPPFGTTPAELQDRFGGWFKRELEFVPRSFPNRKNEELLMVWRKRARRAKTTR